MEVNRLAMWHANEPIVPPIVLGVKYPEDDPTLILDGKAINRKLRQAPTDAEHLRLLLKVVWLLFGPFGEEDCEVVRNVRVNWPSLRKKRECLMARRHLLGLPVKYFVNMSKRVFEPTLGSSLLDKLLGFKIDDESGTRVGLCPLVPKLSADSTTDYWLLMRSDQEASASNSSYNLVVALRIILRDDYFEVGVVQNQFSLWALLAEQKTKDIVYLNEKRFSEHWDEHHKKAPGGKKARQDKHAPERQEQAELEPEQSHEKPQQEEQEQEPAQEQETSLEEQDSELESVSQTSAEADEQSELFEVE